MGDDTTQNPSQPRRKRGRPRSTGDAGVSRIQGARFDDATVARLDRILLHVFGRDIPQGARSELVRICVEQGLQNVEYRVNSGLSVDEGAPNVSQQLPERSSRAGVLRAFRLVGGAREEPEQRRAEQRETEARRRRRRLG